MSAPIFSIVTPALNARAFLPRHLASIRMQGMADGQVEHWVIDGGSRDGTVEYLEGQADVRFISERDRGLSDAVNKGLARARGEWIIWLNADDELAPGALQSFMEQARRNPEARIFCGQQKVFGYDGTLEELTAPWDYALTELLEGRTAIIQASTFVHRSVYERVGGMSDSFRYAMDYEWLVRAMHHFACIPIPVLLTHYHRRRGSIMDAGIAGQHREFLRVRRMYGRPRLSRAEARFRLYLATEPLRRLPWLRGAVRRMKTVAGLR